MKTRFLAILAALAIVFGPISRVDAQWLTQTVMVTNGWTAMYLFVDASSQAILPAPGLPISPDNPIDKIWLWKAPPSTAQYITTPSSPLSAGGAWVSWGRANAQNSLAALIPNQAYLIHSTAPTNYSWKIQGRPVPPAYVWDVTGLNLIGFSTPTVSPPNFQNFLARDPVLANNVQIYQYVGGEFSTNQPLNPAPVISQYYTPVNRGQAFWISGLTTNTYNKYFAPFQVELPNPGGLNYGTSGGQFTFHLLNLTSNSLTVTMTLLPSEAAPYGQTPIVAPPPLLLEGALNASNQTYAYTALAASSSPVATNSVSWTLAPYGASGSEVPVVLGVNRYAMTGNSGSLFAGILQFTDSLGFSAVNVPVSATTTDNSGLWVGSASVNQVNYDLKSYATNDDGTLMITTVTNLNSTNYTYYSYPPYSTTNLLVNYTATTNFVLNNYVLTNEVNNTYTTNGFLVVTNGFVVSTNLFVNFTSTTNLTIQTTVVGFYYDTNGLEWVTTNTTNGPFVTSTTNSTLASVTNLLAFVPPNGTLEPVTNIEYDNYTISSFLVTNGIFSPPVTNEVFAANYTVTNRATGFCAAYDVVTTKLVTGSYSTDSGPMVTNYFVPSTNVAAVLAVTNYYPAQSPLALFTNGNNLIALNVITNQYNITNVMVTAYATNSQVISNNYSVGQNGTVLVGSATNNIFSVSSSSQTVVPQHYTSLALAFTTNTFKTLTNYLISSVSNYVVTAHNTNLDSVVAPYPLRLIVFNDGSGNCSLLQRVYYGIRQSTNIVVATTESVLDRSHLNTARRITATHLPWAAVNTPWAFSGGALAQGASLTSAPIVEAYNDQAANPFLHTYHPDHNNLDNRAPPHELPMGSESYTITRVINLSLVANNNDFLSLTSANSSLSGIYNETISLTGLGGATKNYQTAGTFTLKRVSPISTLTTQ